MLGPAPLNDRLVRKTRPLGHRSREQLFADDGELRDLNLDPLGLRVHLGGALARLRILDEPLAVPDRPASVERVGDDAARARAAAVDGRRVPVPAEW